MNRLVFRKSLDGLDDTVVRELNFLSEKINYLKPEDQERVENALWYAHEGHIAQKRKNGDPYITHPIAVTAILAELKLDATTLIAALLHDTIEDVEHITEAAITQEFGHIVAFLVLSVTKLEKLERQSKDPQQMAKSARERQLENLQMLLIQASRDMRALLIKLADRLHNMRTLGHLKKEKQKRIASETLEAYAPLASLLGLRQWKIELEDISFKILEENAYHNISNMLETMKESIDEVKIESISESFKKLLRDHNIPFDKVYGRIKSPYSIYRKSKAKSLLPKDLLDLVAFRIIVKNRKDCYRALWVFHKKYRHVPNSFDDYISAQKSNGYQSLHTVIFGPNRKRIELQIRSKGMHQVAENGIAAHWRYKNNLNLSQSGVNLVSQIHEDMDKSQMNKIIMSGINLELLSKDTVVYTPKGNLIRLPAESTVLDFAYRVHSEHIGPFFHQAKVNDQLVPMGYIVKRGDTVEIITDPSIKPKRFWLDNVRTNPARSLINQALDIEEAEEFNNFLTEIRKPYNQEKPDAISPIDMRKIYEKLEVADVQEIEEKIFSGQMHPDRLLKLAYPHMDLVEAEIAQKEPLNTTVDYRVNPCTYCMPVPGDDLSGLWLHEKGTIAHRADCFVIKNRTEHYCFVGTVQLPTKNYDTNEGYPVLLDCCICHKPGMMGMICSIIGDRKVNILDLAFLDKGDSSLTLRFYLMVHHATQIDDIIDTIHRRAPEKITCNRVITEDISTLGSRKHIPSFTTSL